MKKKLITAALPYSNGDIHLGHLVEHIQLDIWARYQRAKGIECYCFCADDTHGTPIMLSAKKKGISPEEMIAKTKHQHQKDISDFDVKYDYYSMTHTETNKSITYEIFEGMEKQSYIDHREIEQLYCQNCKMFLPDRFVVGTCPKCNCEEQYGDSCDICGATYDPSEMKNPICTLCGKTPITKSTSHLFFKLSNFQDFLLQWTEKVNSKEAFNKLKEWLSNDLKDWNISRDSPYFGFEIPNYPNKYFYVWVDAPIGYISTTKEWADQKGFSIEDYWCNPEMEIIHFIGKDILYFHSLFWPSMLKTSRYQLPSKIVTHGFLTINGKKMSKSKGTFILARDYKKHLDINYLRYYYASKMDGSMKDIDLNIDEFRVRNNTILIGKITNIISRGAQMLNQYFDGSIVEMDEEGKSIQQEIISKRQRIEENYESHQYHKVIIDIRDMADVVNQYFDRHKPWKMVKNDLKKTQTILSTILICYRIMAIYLSPIIPQYAKKVRAIYGEDQPWYFEDIYGELIGKKINKYEHILKRVENKDVQKVFSV